MKIFGLTWSPQRVVEQTYKGKVSSGQTGTPKTLCMAATDRCIDLLVAENLFERLRNPFILLLAILPTSLLITMVVGGMVAIWFLFGCMVLLVY
ncbi:MAG: hypothetical protein DRO11_10100, partial [Methanobacteriota archaeon]